MTNINKVAVIGSGLMGSQIAAHVANSGVPVVMLDIVPKEGGRNDIAQGALDRLKKSDPEAFTHKRNAKLVTIGNIEDDLDKLADCDWIIEAVIERLDIKQSLYKNVIKYAKADAVISSNTSTLPFAELVKGMGRDFEKRFCIAHFFNPPRYMRLLEVVGEAADKITDYADKQLGKTVIKCKDTAGFIANRIGTFWIQAAFNNALDMKVDPQTADVIMKPCGIPKTGVFGLADLVGVDLLPLIAKSYADILPDTDGFNKIYKERDFVKNMLADGYKGRKSGSKGGFYRMNDEKIKETRNLETGEYSFVKKKRVKTKGIKATCEAYDYAWAVFRDTLVYVLQVAEEISFSIPDIDEAMKLGYNWKQGPFEMLDALGVEWFESKLKEDGIEVPALLSKLGGSAYEAKTVYTYGGSREEIKIDNEKITLEDVKGDLIVKKASAKLWDIGDGVACLQYTSKMNSIDPTTLEAIVEATEEVSKNFKGMVVANDSSNFTAGANIGFLLYTANVAGWKFIEGVIKQGQDAYMGLKYADFPVVAAPTGMCLGGGTELLLHSDWVQAHAELYAGLVEVGVGVVPGWGGCKEYVLRSLKKRAESDSVYAKMGGWFSFLSPVRTLNTMQPLRESFINISTAKVSKSAVQAKENLILNQFGITANRSRLLADAKAKCLELAVDYKAPETAAPVRLPGKTAYTAFKMGINDFHKAGKITDYDVEVSLAVARVLSGGDTSITKEVTEQQLLDLELQEFVRLCKDERTLDRIEHMLEKGKPLRN